MSNRSLKMYFIHVGPDVAIYIYMHMHIYRHTIKSNMYPIASTGLRGYKNTGLSMHTFVLNYIRDCFFIQLLVLKLACIMYVSYNICLTVFKSCTVCVFLKIFVCDFLLTQYEKRLNNIM